MLGVDQHDLNAMVDSSCFCPGFFHRTGMPGSANSRFFLMGDGNLHLVNMHTGKEAQAQLLAPDGSFPEEGFLKIDEVFDFPTEEKGEHIAPRQYEPRILLTPEYWTQH